MGFRFDPISTMYEPFENCSWTIVVPDGRYILAKFEQFSMADQEYTSCETDEKDKLEIYDIGNGNACLLGKLCGNNAIADIYSTTNKMFLNFQRGSMYKGQCTFCKPTKIKFTSKQQ